MKRFFMSIALIFFSIQNSINVFAQSEIKTTQMGPFPIISEIGNLAEEDTGIIGVKKDIEQQETNLTEIKNSNEFDQKELKRLKKKKDDIKIKKGELTLLLLQIQELLDTPREEGEIFTIDEKLKQQLEEKVAAFYKEINKKEVPKFSLEGLEKYIAKIDEDHNLWIEKTDEDIKNLVISIENKTEEIQKAKVYLDKQKNILSGLLLDYAKRIGNFFGIIFLVWFIFKLLQIFLKRHTKNEQNDRVKTLLNVFSWIRNVIIFVTIIIFFFSEFTQFLPFLAILGTALGFALRDIISSIIAWFVLGYKDSLYKVGDIIKIENEDIYGKVLQISPTVTTIKELGLSGTSGVELTFPNKFIFEKSVKNRSKLEKFVYVTIEFLCEHTTNFNELEKAIGIAVSETKDHFSFPTAKDISLMLFKAGLTAKHLEHKIIYTNFSHGLRVRVKMLLIRGSIISTKSYLTKRIIENINNAEGVHIRTIDFPEAE